MSSDQNKAKLLNRLSAHRIPVLCTVVFLFLIVLLSILELTKAESVAITLTGVVIIWYTWETHQLKSEMKRQTALMLKPYVIATPDSGSPERYKFNLCNVGNGSAVAVKVFLSGRELEHRVHLLPPKNSPRALELNIREESDQFYLKTSFFDIENNHYSIQSLMDKTQPRVKLLSVEELTDN